MAKKLHLEIVTAEGSVCDELADFVLAPVENGDEGILPDHAAMVASLTHGVLRYKADDEEHYAALSGGVLSLADNELIVLAESAETAENIDLAREKVNSLLNK